MCRDRILRILTILWSTGAVWAADPPVQVPSSTAASTPSGAKSGEAKLTPLNPQQTVLLDKANRKLVLKGTVCLREGVLEMLACLKRTKEHEAILAVDTKAQIVHAGLLALGIEPGRAVEYQPEFKPATGPRIDIYLNWTDSEGKARRVKAQTWVRNATRRYWIETLPKPLTDLKLPDDSDLRYDPKRRELLWYGPMSDAQRDALLKLSADPDYKKAITNFHQKTQVKEFTANWVFAGSGFHVDTETGEKFYQAEAGDLICVANFATATIDISTASSATNEELLYEAYTERIPPVGTAITIELIPVADAAAPGKTAPEKTPSRKP